MTNVPTILVIDDSLDMRKVMQIVLHDQGYRVLTAEDGETGLQLVREQRPDLVVLDLSMPVVDGWEVCERIREHSTVPIIIVTAAHVTDEDMVRGLDMGANDYVVKPFRNSVLLARIRNALRWVTAVDDGVNYDDGYLQVNLPLRQVYIQGKLLPLTKKEFEMLAVLIQATPKVVTHEELFSQVWDESYEFDVNYVRIFVGHIRKKLEGNGRSYIHNERGVGYRFVKQDAAE
jgi:two-component system KDP operon response regulator KdpE